MAIKLTDEQHRQIAELLNTAQDQLKRATRIVNRAPYTDRTLHVSGMIQEWLIDPLSRAWDDAHPREGFHDNPYQSVGYGSPWKRKLPPKDF